jgi:hypothetical protein
MNQLVKSFRSGPRNNQNLSEVPVFGHLTDWADLSRNARIAQPLLQLDAIRFRSRKNNSNLAVLKSRFLQTIK